jgi:DNA-binding transcriptional LysR family regulator
MRTALRRYFRHGILPQLMVFETVARLGSVTRAGEELHLAQPTVSMQLRKLQDCLGLKLIEWRGRQMTLTPAGRDLQAACGELFELFGAIEAKLAAHRDATAAPQAPAALRLAAVPGARQLASRLLASFCTRHPGVPASLHVGESAELLERCEAGADHIYLLGNNGALEGQGGHPLADLFLREALGAAPAMKERGEPA